MSRESRREIFVRVTNNSKKLYVDGFEGEVYKFKPNTTVLLPLAAAAHIFGYEEKGGDPATMFAHTCKRWGWNTHENVLNEYNTYQDEKGKKHIGPKEIWSQFDFTPVARRYEEIPIIDTASLAAPRDKDEALEAVA